MGEYGVVISSLTSSSSWIRIPDHDFTRTLFEGLQTDKDTPAIVDVLSAREITSTELRQRAELVARHLLKHGCRKGDRFAIFAPNSIEWVVILLAAVRIGTIPVTINCQLRPNELRDQLQRSRVRSIYTTGSLVSSVLEAIETLDEQPKIFLDGRHPGCFGLDSMLVDDGGLPILPSFDQLHLSAEDPFLILFSSGTTGIQKAVILSHRNLHAQNLILCDDNAKVVLQRQVVFTPFSHIFALFGIIFGIVEQSVTYMLTRFQLADYLKILEDQKIESIMIVPPIAVLLVKSPEVVKFRLSLKYVVCGAAPLSEALENELKQRFAGVKFVQAYGITESSSVCCIVPTNAVKDKPNSVGPPCVNTQMKVIDLKTSKPLGPNVEGEICVKGPTVMMGYFGDPETTKATIDQNGWLHSGDIGYYDEDGYFYVVDRLKELIKYNAYQVAPAELEAVLLTHPQVADAGVVGQPDPMAGEIPMGWVVMKAGAIVTEQELEQFVSERVAPYKRLRGGIRFVASIPRTASGKILRREMKNAILSGRL